MHYSFNELAGIPSVQKKTGKQPAKTTKEHIRKGEPIVI